MTREELLERMGVSPRHPSDSRATNLYVVCDRRETCMFVVVGHSADECLDFIREIGMEDWTVGNTHTRKIQGNVDCEPGVLTAVGMSAKTAFRRHDNGRLRHGKVSLGEAARVKAT